MRQETKSSQEAFHDTTLWILFFLVLFTVSSFWTFVTSEQIPKPKQEGVVLRMEGWAKLMKKPIPIVRSDISIQPTIGLTQVEIEMGRVQMTAFYPGRLGDIGFWKVGDEVMVTSFQCKGTGTLSQTSPPSTIYIVIGYRPQKQ
ncbi:MAG: hypothetical protein WC793_01255 [Candidatus Paceibacterota bacterium]